MAVGRRAYWANRGRIVGERWRRNDRAGARSWRARVWPQRVLARFRRSSGSPAAASQISKVQREPGRDGWVALGLGAGGAAGLRRKPDPISPAGGAGWGLSAVCGELGGWRRSWVRRGSPKLRSAPSRDGARSCRLAVGREAAIGAIGAKRQRAAELRSARSSRAAFAAEA
jgi:hypothetical protein